MAKLEGSTQREIWLALGRICRLFRLNTGMAWMSNLGPRGVIRQRDGSVLIQAARPIAIGFGAPDGSPVAGACDLPGWTTVTVTPDMVGKQVAVFTSIECKSSKGGRKRTEQVNWATQVEKYGGIAGFANSPESARQIIDDWCRRNGAEL